MAKSGGDAGDWSLGDMQKDQADMGLAKEENIVIDNVETEEQAKAMRRKLGPRAKRDGASIDIKKQRNGRWDVIVSKPKGWKPRKR